MKFSTKIILGIIAIAVLCLVYYSDDYFSRKKEEKKEELAKALFFKTADVTKFSLTNPNGKFTFTTSSSSSPSEWKMLEPQQINADQDAVANTLTALSQINVQQELDATEHEKKETFSLDKPKVTASVTLKDNKAITLEIGGGVDIGGKNNTTPISVYGLNSNRPNVLVLDATNVNSIMNKSFSDFRTKRVAIFKAQDVAAFSINSKDINISIEKKQSKWNILKQQNSVADDNFITSFIATYQSLFAQKVIEKNEVAKVGLEKYDLAAPAAKVKFSDEHGKVLQEFSLGITKEAVYMLMPDGAVAQFNLSSWPDYVPRAVKFQNRQVLLGVNTSQIQAIQFSNSLYYEKKDSNWYKRTDLKTPINTTDKPSIDALSFFSNFEFMAADDVISSPNKTDLDKFGLSQPSRKFSFIFNSSSKQIPLEISIGNKVPLNNKSVYIKRSDSEAVFIVNGDWLTQLDKLTSTKI